jgi:glycosyltransferase involved in cell wall biosynthesis
MILNCMLAAGYGGLEKLFLDEIEMLPQSGLSARGLVARNGQLARYARERHLEFDQIFALSDWDPISIAGARRVLRHRAPELVMCVGRKAHRLMARSVTNQIPIVPMVQKRRFDRTLPYSGVLVAAEHRRLTLISDGVPADKIIVIPNAVRLPARPKGDYRKKDNEAANIVALGRLHEKKGLGVLIEAVKLLTTRGIACTCTIAGEGPERQTLEAKINGESMGGRVSLCGWTDEVPEFLATGDIFVLPSFQEDFPLAVLDAMASGLPIVASAIDGPKDFLVHGATALLVPPRDAHALADALTLLIADASLREKLGRTARRAAVENYSFEAVGRRLASALRNVLTGRAISSGL